MPTKKHTPKAEKRKSALPTDRDNFKIIIGPDGKISVVDKHDGHSLSDEKVGVERMTAIRKEISPNLDETNFAVAYDYFPDPIEVYGINCTTGQRIPDDVVGLHRMECIRRVHENLFRSMIESHRNMIEEGARRGSWNLREAIEWFFMKRDYMKEPDSDHQQVLTRNVNAALAAHNDKRLSLSFVGSDLFVSVYDLIRWAATIEHNKDWHICIEMEKHAAYIRLAPTLPKAEPIPAVQATESNGGALTVTEAAQLHPTVQNNCFERKGAGFQIRFEGVGFVLPNLKGAGILHKLISKSGVEIPLQELDPAHVVENIVEDRQSREASEKKPMATIHEADIVDGRTIHEVKDRLAVLKDKLEDAQTVSNVEEQERIEKEMKPLLDYIGSVTNLSGKPRKRSLEIRNQIRAVQKSVRDIYTKLADPLKKHLEESEPVNFSVSCVETFIK